MSGGEIPVGGGGAWLIGVPTTSRWSKAASPPVSVPLLLTSAIRTGSANG